MVPAVLVCRDELKPRGVGASQVLDGPAEAPRVVGIDGFKDEQDGTEFEEDDCAYKGGYPAAVVGFSWELGAGSYQGQPGEVSLARCQLSCRKLVIDVR
jgi:hypothetical protein